MKVYHMIPPLVIMKTYGVYDTIVSHSHEESVNMIKSFR